MHPAQLGHRVVAVLDEHLFVEGLGPVDPDRFATDIARLEQLVAAALGAGGVE
jgi:hypothetical protein